MTTAVRNRLDFRIQAQTQIIYVVSAAHTKYCRKGTQEANRLKDK